jgi:hypothetical protein
VALCSVHRNVLNCKWTHACLSFVKPEDYSSSERLQTPATALGGALAAAARLTSIVTTTELVEIPERDQSAQNGEEFVLHSPLEAAGRLCFWWRMWMRANGKVGHAKIAKTLLPTVWVLRCRRSCCRLLAPL